MTSGKPSLRATTGAWARELAQEAITCVVSCTDWIGNTAKVASHQQNLRGLAAGRTAGPAAVPASLPSRLRGC